MMHRGDAVAGTWILRGDAAAATTRRFRGGDSAAATWIFRGESAQRCGHSVARRRYQVDPARSLRRGVGIRNDLICLESDDPLEKFTLAYALAQSAKLFVWESRVDDTIKSVRHIPERLALTGSTNLSDAQVSRMIGRIFTESMQVNLYSEILDSPNFLWENDAYEPAYVGLRAHLDVPDRVELLNKRLDILKELLDVLNTQLSNRHSSRLEVIVIWLIVAEIVVTLCVFIAEHVSPKRWL